ncbi:MAG: class I SAM-dependent methyltransferase [Rhodospirillaceae bacterium]
MTSHSYAGEDLEVLAAMPNYHGWIMEEFGPFICGQVVEYGAGIGTMSAHLQRRADALTLVEPSTNLFHELQRRFATASGVAVVNAPLESHVLEIAPASVDTIVLINVLEHVENDSLALRHLMNALRPSGHLLLFVPALNILMSKLDRSLGHYRRYHRQDLLAKTRAAGGAIERCRYMDAFGVLPWFFLNTLLGSMSFDPRLVRFNDRYIVPLSQRAERRVAPPFGKNLLLVARKA